MPNISKPSKIKELSGNPGKRKTNKAEPRPLADPSAPTGMSATAKTIFNRLILAMPSGVYTSVDSYLLAAYCEAVARHQYAVGKLNRGPKEVTGSTGQIKLSPWYSEVSEAARLMVTIGAKLGLDPIARQHIVGDTGGRSGEDFDGLIN